MAKSIKTCRFGHCLHGENKSINIEEDEYELEGKSSYYHKDCYKTKSDLIIIRNLWKDHIDPYVVYAQLNRVLNNLVFAEQVSTDYIIFAIKYVADHKGEINLNSPFGLKYILGNRTVKTAYEKKNNPQIDETDFSIDTTKINPFGSKFSYKPNKKSGFGSIFGGNY